jgi:hypothetical protein
VNTDKTRCMTLALYGLLCGFALTAIPAGALEMPPGRWAINSETIAPMAPEPIVEYTEDCIEDNFDPVSLIQAEMTEQCAITTNIDTATELDADLQCAIPGAPAGSGTVLGKLLFSVDGDNARGQMNMSINMGGQVMEMSSKWSAQRLGACD